MATTKARFSINRGNIKRKLSLKQRLSLYIIYAKLAVLSLFFRIYKVLSFLLIFASSYICMFAVRYADAQRGYIAYGGEMFLPLLVATSTVGILEAGNWLVKNYPRLLQNATRDILDVKGVVLHNANKKG